jgi:ComF family protein
MNEIFDKIMREIYNSIIDVIFPRYCLVCDKIIYGHEQYLCLKCEGGIPFGYYNLGTENPVEKTFWGRCKIDAAGAYIKYRSDSKYASLIKNIKYDGGMLLANDLGNKYGNWLKGNHMIDNYFDCLVPVPMHPKKLRKRGYNQSEEIAKGLSLSLGIPLDMNILKRDIDAESQTKKNRFSRWENTKDLYALNELNDNYNHIVIVDDVITTGSTIESCVRAVHQFKDVKVSVLALGFTL